MFDEASIQLNLNYELRSRNHMYIIPNVSWSWLCWEADLISFTRAGYMNEYEIKCTKQDFMNDFSKRKHQNLKRGIAAIRVPNYFWYVAPLDVVPLCIPDYAGLMVASIHPANLGLMVFEVVKKPVMIHKLKVPDKGKLAMLNAGMMKYWNAARTINQYVRRQSYQGE